MKLSPLLILSAVHAHEIKDFMGSRAFALSVIKNIKYIVQALHLIFFPPDTAHCFMHIIKHTPKYSKQFIEQIPSFPVRVIVHNVSFRSIRRCFTAYSHYMCCWQILQHTKKRRTPHFTYGARHFVYRSYTPLILLMLNFTDARYRYIHRCSANVTFAALMNSFASQKESCSHLNHFLTHQNSKCSAAIFYRCQISSLYCAMVLSDEKKPAWLMFTSIFFAHAIRSS